MKDIVFTFKFFLGVAMLVIVAWVLLGFPAVTHENGCTRIDSAFLRSFDYVSCDMNTVEAYLKGLIPTVILAGTFMFLRAWRIDARKPRDEFEGEQ